MIGGVYSSSFVLLLLRSYGVVHTLELINRETTTIIDDDDDDDDDSLCSCSSSVFSSVRVVLVHISILILMDFDSGR